MTIIKTEEFEDEGYVYIREFYKGGRVHVKQKPGVNYPSPPKTEQEILKDSYTALKTSEERIDFLARHNGLID